MPTHLYTAVVYQPSAYIDKIIYCCIGRDYVKPDDGKENNILWSINEFFFCYACTID